MPTIYKWDNPVNWHTKQDQSHSQDQTSRSPLKWATRIHNSKTFQYSTRGHFGFILGDPSHFNGDAESRFSVKAPIFMDRAATDFLSIAATPPRGPRITWRQLFFSQISQQMSAVSWVFIIQKNVKNIFHHFKPGTHQLPFPVPIPMISPGYRHHPKLIQVMVTGPDPSAFLGIFLIRFRTSRGSVTCQVRAASPSRIGWIQAPPLYEKAR